MNTNQQTSRGEPVEAIELIANQIASFSHHREIYNSLETDLAHPELFTEEQIEEKQSEAYWHFEKLISLTEERRKTMRALKSMARNANDELRCIVKHSIWSYQFAQELLATDFNNIDYIELAEKASQYMYECISKFLWIEIVTCWRCLSDELAWENLQK